MDALGEARTSKVEKRLEIASVLILAVLLPVFAIKGLLRLHEAMERSRERRTTQAMLAWSQQLDHAVVFPTKNAEPSRQPPKRMRMRATKERPLLDGWGTPLAIHVFADGYEIRSAAADRKFDRVVFEGEKARREQDLIFADGEFTQWPANSISLPENYDPRPKRPSARTQMLTKCSSCHDKAY